MEKLKIGKTPEDCMNIYINECPLCGVMKNPTNRWKHNKTKKHQKLYICMLLSRQINN